MTTTKMSDAKVRDICKRTLCKGELTEDELDVYLAKCELHGVHPLSEALVPQLYSKDNPEKRKMKCITTIQLMRSKADATGAYSPGKETEHEFDKEGKLKLSRAWTVKYVGGHREEYPHVARWKEYAGDTSAWKSMGTLMLDKCAEGGGIRRGFPRETGDLYEAAEMDQARDRERQEEPSKDERLEKARDAMDQTPASEEEQPQGLSTKEQDVLDGFVAGLSEIPRDDEDLEAGKEYVRGIDYGTASDLLKSSISKSYREWQGDRKRAKKQREGAGQSAPTGGAE